ncbi:MAG: peptide ABC transporter substrate-binding protein [Lactobacillaceae bacterium]|jgi:ABC-type oligopeptide transport system substrate-binding subunit|nr:peptide ABC transporter substrate-binding protein [Lactobacillaceae bacterium]
MHKIKKYMMVGLASVLVTSSIAPMATAAAKTKPINWTLAADLVTLDPSLANDITSGQIITQTGQALYRYSADGKPELADAKKVKVAKDGLTWTFTLKSGLKWSDGTPVEASDYVYAWRRTLDPKNASTVDAIAYNIVNAAKVKTGEITDLTKLGIEAPDAKTLVVHLTSPIPMLPSVITAMGFYPQNEAFAKKVGTKFGTAAQYTCSNGPFILKDWNGSSTSFKLVKNPQYIDAKKVKTKTINFQTVVESNAVYNLYKAGKADFVKLDADQVKQEQKSKAYHQIKTARTNYLTIAQRNKTLKNVKLHQALQYAINKKVLANKILSGSAIPSTTFTPSGLIKDPNTGKDFSVAAKTAYTKYSPAKAKAAWKQAKKELGIKKLHLQLLTDNDDINKKVGQYIQSQLQDTLPGFTIEMKSQPKAARIKKMLAYDYDLIVSGWAGTTTDPTSFIGVFQTGEAMNFADWSNQQFDADLKAAQTTDVLKPKVRMQKLIAAEKLLQKDAPVITLYYESTPALIRTNIKGLQINQTGATFDFTTAVKK